MENSIVREELMEEISTENYNVPKEHIVYLKGKPFVMYEGVLAAAHSKGVKSLKVIDIQFPNEQNGMTCIMKAELIGKDDTIFIDYGDASPLSVTSQIIPHIIRQASTRAKARVLRDFCNIGICTVDELIDTELVEDKATDKQKKIIAENRQITDEELDKLTKSQASAIIDQIMNNKGNKKGSTNLSSNKGSGGNAQATPKQRDILRKYAEKLNLSENEINTISKQKASELIEKALNPSSEKDNEEKSSTENSNSKQAQSDQTIQGTGLSVAEAKLLNFYIGVVAKKEGKTDEKLKAEIEKDFGPIDKLSGAVLTKSIIPVLQKRK